jgi:DNA-binding NarL/FixJ family response regulator
MYVIPSLRLFLADQDDFAALGMECFLQQHEIDAQFHYFQSLPELKRGLELLAIQPQLPLQYKDILLLGKCAMQIPVDMLRLIKLTIEITQMPIVLLGDITEGWIIGYLLQEYDTVHGYLHRHDRLQDVLLPAIRAVKDGQQYMSPTARLIVEQSQKTRLEKRSFGPDEIAVLRHLARGMDETDIAARLHVTTRRVYTITNRLRYLFGVDTNEAMVIRARECGMC